MVAAVNGPALAGGFALVAALRPAGRLGTRRRFGYPELPRGIPPSYAAARAVLPATVAQELCLTGPDRAARPRPSGSGSSARSPPATSVARALALAERIAGLPRAAILETKRRTLLERRHLWGFLFDEEERVFRRALLGEDATARPPESAGVAGRAQSRGDAAARICGQT